MRQNRSYALALAGVGSAVSLLGVILARYVSVMSLTFNILSAIGLMLPLSRGYVRSAALSFVAVSLLSLTVGVQSFAVFTLFFGAYTLILYLLDFYRKKSRKPLARLGCYAIKFAYFNLVLWAGLQLLPLMGISLQDYSFFGLEWTNWLIFTAGNVAFLVYDLFLRILLKNLIVAVSKYLKRGRKPQGPKKGQEDTFFDGAEEACGEKEDASEKAEEESSDKEETSEKAEEESSDKEETSENERPAI